MNENDMGRAQTQSQPALVKNRPTVLGRDYGKELARMCDVADAEQRRQFPNQAERCASCAFRSGTIPNGCESTLMDATKCALERVPFYCHEVKGDEKQVCAGWMVMQAAGVEAIKVPWPFSDEIDAG